MKRGGARSTRGGKEMIYEAIESEANPFFIIFALPAGLPMWSICANPGRL